MPIENIPKYIKMGHLSPIEHASATFRIEGISRACLSQLTRHRLASYSVESMRYCDVSENVIVMPDSMRNADLLDKHLYFDAIEYAIATYQNLIDSGIPREDARFVLPLGITTNLLITANFRQLRHMIQLRTAPSAQWEIRQLFEKILDIMIEQSPIIFKDLKNDN